MTLGDFVKQLVSQLCSENIKIPFENETPWHELFYKLKKLNLREGKPPFLSELRFDWDGRYPKCKQLSEFLHALHWNASVSAANPQFNYITLPDNIAEDWKNNFEELAPDTQDFIAHAKDLAKDEFNSCPCYSGAS